MDQRVELTKDKKSDLLEVLWLQQMANKLKEYYEDVRVDMIFGDGEREPMIFVHNIPITVDEVEELLTMLPYEQQLARQEVMYDIEHIRTRVEQALAEHKKNLEEDLQDIKDIREMELKAVEMWQQEKNDTMLSEQSERAEEWRKSNGKA